MIKVQDYLKELKVRREIGREQFDKLYIDFQKSYNEASAIRDDNLETSYLRYFLSSMTEYNERIKYADFMAIISCVVATSTGIVELFGSGATVFDGFVGISSALSALYAVKWAKNERDAYKQTRQSVKAIIRKKIEDYENSVCENEEFHLNDNILRINGNEISENVLDVLSTKLCEDISLC